MPVKDKIVRWFIQNVLVPKTEIIDHPGFIATQFGSTFLREIAVPESLFTDLEERISEKYGEKGNQALYSAGKKFIYRYAAASNFPTIASGGKNVEKFLYNFVRYAEATTYGKIDYKADIESRTARITLENYMVCPHNGMGYVLSWGSIAGLWSYLMNDAQLEGIQIKCQGQKYDKCEVLCGPIKTIKDLGLIFYTEKKPGTFSISDSYKQINKAERTEYAKKSFKDMLDSGMITYNKGVVERNGERYFIIEAGLIYIIEEELSKLKGASKILYGTAFDAGKRIASKEGSDYQRFFMDFLPAMGWGDISTADVKGKMFVKADYYPWSELSDESEFLIFSGIVSGMLSSFGGKKAMLRKTSSMMQKGFSIVVSE